MFVKIETVTSEWEKAAETDVFRTGDTEHKNSHHIQVTTVYMQCCRISFAQPLDCMQVCLTFVKIRLYLAQNFLQ
jgi:hypothetical protein